MGPPPRSFAADAHDCIMVRVLGPSGSQRKALHQYHPSKVRNAPACPDGLGASRGAPRAEWIAQKRFGVSLVRGNGALPGELEFFPGGGWGWGWRCRGRALSVII
jgi:hypothetical protein